MVPILQKLTGLLQDPLPDFVFELTETGIAFARPPAGVQPAFQPIEPGVLKLSPLANNVLKPDALADSIRAINGTGTGRRRGRAVVILPDHSSRVAVLGFDKFPTDSQEQTGLVRFRMKKSVPFEVDSAVISYHVQSSSKARTEVVVGVAALDIISHYEAAFRAAGLQPGWVTTAAIATAELIPSSGISVAARLTGSYLSVLVLNGSQLKLVRTVELVEFTEEEVLAVLLPTLAYVEDELGAIAARLHLCGFDREGRVPDWVSELQVPVEPLRSRFGTPDGNNAGLLGYLESMGSGAKAA